MRSVRGPITARLREQLDPDDPAWFPPRDADAPTTSRKPTETWSITGRRTTTKTSS